MDSKKFKSSTFLWAIIDTFVNIITMIAVIILLSNRIQNWFLVFMILVFLIWAFRPMYLSFKEFLEKFPKKKKKARYNSEKVFFILLLCYLVIFAISVLILVESITFLGSLVHPLVLSFSFIVSALLISFYHHYTKKEFKGPLWSFSKLFFLTTIFLFIAVIFFSSFGLTQGVNLYDQKIEFNIYSINSALNYNQIDKALNYSSSLWKKYNISIIYGEVNTKDINISQQEILFLFNNGSTSEECSEYLKIINKITNNSNNLSLIFIKNIDSKHAGRGCLCNCTFALVSPEKWWIFDFTGWNVAHEIGHILGLSDMPYQGRIRENLMNDETKKLLFFNSGFLDQNQINTAINKTKSLN